MPLHPVELFDEETPPPPQPDRRADEVLVRTLCDHDALWPAVDAGAARALMAWQVENAVGGVVDLAPLFKYVLDLGVDALAAAIFVVDLAGELDVEEVVATVPPEVDDVLDQIEIVGGVDPRFSRPWQ
jgi:hypothetical protein